MTLAWRYSRAATFFFTVLVGCASVRPSQELLTTEPAERAVAISTTACGDASRTSGGGVIVRDGFVLTAAHVVIGAGDVTVISEGRDLPARIVRLDPRTDLAMLSVEGVAASPAELVDLSRGSVVVIAPPPPEENVTAMVLRRVEVRIEEVRSNVRSSRRGYELDVRVELGDSGAGVFDRTGALAGIVYGRPLEDSSRSFVVGAAEIDVILDQSVDSTFVCDPAQHRVVERSTLTG